MSHDRILEKLGGGWYGRGYIEAGHIAEEYAFLGDKDHTFEWLERLIRKNRMK